MHFHMQRADGFSHGRSNRSEQQQVPKEYAQSSILPLCVLFAYARAVRMSMSYQSTTHLTLLGSCRQSATTLVFNIFRYSV